LKQEWENFWKNSSRERLARMSHSKRRMLDVLRPHLRPGMRVLDAGCGSGWFTATFLDLGLDATALDYSDEALAVARDLCGGRGRFMAGDLLDSALPSILQDRFDLIFSDGLFEHFVPSDQDRIMANFVALGGPRATIATFVPNLLSPWQLIRPFMMPGIREKPFLWKGLRRLTRDLDMLASGGLNVLPVRASPERLLGSHLGMILYAIGRARSAPASGT
jgi:SAM-dependent methyltransferase